MSNRGSVPGADADADRSVGESDDLVTALLTASRALVGVSARSLAGVEDTVTLSQFRTLVVLRVHGASRLNALAERLHVNASSALRTVDRLVAAGLVDRRENPADRREVVLDVTRSGKRLVDEVTDRRRQAIGEIVEAMTPQRRKALVEALLAFTAAADEPLVGDDVTSSLGW